MAGSLQRTLPGSLTALADFQTAGAIKPSGGFRFLSAPHQLALAASVNQPKTAQLCTTIAPPDTLTNRHSGQPSQLKPKPNQNAYIKSFNGCLRDVCLNKYWFASLAHAKAVIEAWRREYNEERPKKSLGGLTPSAYASQLAGKSATLAPGL